MRHRRRWLVSHNGYTLLRRHAQMATMKRSDSTTLPSGSSMRTGPCTITGPLGIPAPGEDRKRSWFVRPDHEQFLLAPTVVKPTGLLQPLGARRQHWPERNPLPRNDLRIKSGFGECGEGAPRVGEFGLHQQQAAAVGQQVGHGPAQRIEHQSPVVAGVPGARRSNCGGSSGQ